MTSQDGSGRPSQTAIASAVQRALHLLWDAPPHIFYDPFAYPFAGSIADAVIAGLAAALPGEVGRVSRASFVVRHRWAEDEPATSWPTSDPDAAMPNFGWAGQLVDGADDAARRGLMPTRLGGNDDQMKSKKWSQSVQHSANLVVLGLFLMLHTNGGFHGTRRACE